jgi:hypothetical protein
MTRLTPVTVFSPDGPTPDGMVRIGVPSIPLEHIERFIPSTAALTPPSEQAAADEGATAAREAWTRRSRDRAERLFLIAVPILLAVLLALAAFNAWRLFR